MNSTKYVIRQRVQPTVAPLTAAIALGLGASHLQAATITVDTIADGSVAGQCTLRDAFEAANTDTPVNGCAPGSGADEIVFAPGVYGTVNVGSPSLLASTEISVAGPGVGPLTISGSNSYRPFLAQGSTAQLSLSGMIIGYGYSNDYYGGAAVLAIQGAGLSLSDCVITGNVSDGNAVGGAVAAVYASSLSIDNCTISNNSTGSVLTRGTSVTAGGGVLNWGPGPVSITNSTIDSNQAGYAGGGIALFESLSATITNSVISGNDADFGGGLAVLSSADVSIEATLIEGNQALAGGGAIVSSGARISGQTLEIINNIADYDGGGLLAGSLYGGTAPVAGAPSSSTPDGTSPQLIYGQGQAYMSGSYFASNLAGRFGGGGSAKYANSYLVADNSNFISNEAGDRDTNPSAFAGGGAAAGLYGGFVYLLSSQALYNQAPQGGALVAYLGGVGALYSQITDNTATYGGGAQAGVANFYAPSLQGAASAGDVVVVNSTISGNDAFFGGGLSALYGGDLAVAESNVDGNFAGYGAGLSAIQGSLSMKYSTLTNNEAINAGGGLLVLNSPNTHEVIGSTISGNTAYTGGGGLLTQADGYIAYSTISGNQATTAGGLVLMPGGGAYAAELRNTTISDNIAEQIGGLQADSLTARFLTVSHNTASGTPRGVAPPVSGAEIASGFGPIEIINSIFSDGDGKAGTADLSVTGSGTVSVDYTLIETPGVGIPAGTGNLTGVDPQLGPLSDNGGRTLTRSLSASSPAVDAGTPAAIPSYDQRLGPYPRVFNGYADMGAYELFIDDLFSDRFEGP